MPIKKKTTSKTNAMRKPKPKPKLKTIKVGGVKLILPPLKNPPHLRLPQLEPIFRKLPLKSMSAEARVATSTRSSSKAAEMRARVATAAEARVATAARSSSKAAEMRATSTKATATRSSSIAAEMGTRTPKKQDDSLRTYPKNISNMPYDLLLNILSRLFPFLDNIGNKLDNSLISKILAEFISKKLIINKDFATASRMILKEPLFKKINIINLKDLLITKAEVGVLNMTDPNKILSITLEGITFDNAETCIEFFKFFSKNVNVKVLVYDNVSVETSVFLDILQQFRHIVWLEIKTSNLYNKEDPKGKYLYFENFMQVLLNSPKLEYLTLSNNTVVEQEFSNLWSNNYESDNRKTIINGRSYKIYISRYDFDGINCMGMKIVKVRGNRELRKFQVHIDNNSFSYTWGDMQNARNIFTNRKDILNKFREFIGDRRGK